MKFQDLLLFLFSGIGALNGFFLASYFAFFTSKKSGSTKILSLLIATVSIRILKSTLVVILEGSSDTLAPLGLLACIFIGPLLYLYVKAVINIDFNWHAALIKHLFPFVLLLVIAGLIFPSEECWICSEWLRHMMYVIWFYYILLTIITLKKPFRNLLTYHGKLSDLDIWLITITIGIAVVWLAYLITNYSSYIIGAWSFTFVFYAVLFIWLYKFKRTSLFFEKQEKYVDKKIRAVEAKEFGQRLQSFFYVQKPFKDPNLKLSDVALSLEVTPHYLSQFLNDNKNITFSSYINEYRVEEAKLLLGSNNLITIEAIGQECGFKSNSSFYSAFKKLEGVTPAKFKKQYL